MFAAFALVGCEYAVEVLPAELEMDAPDFYAEIADETRTQLNESNRVLWCEDDYITIFKRNDHNLKYKISTLSESRTNATFTYTKEYIRNTGAKYLVYFGVYPFSEYNSVLDNTLSLNLPSNQPYVEGSELKNVPMVAISTDLNLSFQAPTSLLRLNVSRDDMGANPYILKQILVSSESTYISGMVDVDMLATPCKAVVDESSELKSRHISIDLGDGVELTTDNQSFYAALADVTLPADDLTLTFTIDADGKTYDVKKKITAEIHYQAGRVFTAPVQISTDDFTPSNGNSNGGDITESDDFILNDDGSYSCPITEDMIIDEPLYLPNGTTATISLGENATLSNSTYNVNSALVVIDEGADLTIDGSGAITSITATALASTLNATRAASNSAFPIVVNGTLRIKGGDFTLNSYATSWLDCGIYIGPNGKLIVEGGTFRSTKGSYIFGHELGNRPTIEIIGGRFEGYDPSDNDFDGEGSNYLEPEYASYYVAEDELVVAERTANWEVDNSYLLNSILKNGGNATLIDSVHDNWAFNIDNNINVNYPVNISVSGDASKVSGECILYIETPINCYADVNIKCDYTYGDIAPDSYAPDTKLLYIDSNTAIANVYNGATLTLGDATYFGGGDEVSETLFNLYGGNIVVNDGSYTLSERINAANMFVVDPRYAEESSLVVNGGVFYGYNPESVAFGEEVKNCVPEGKGALLAWDGGHYTIKNKGTFTAASYNVDGLPSLINSDGPGSNGTTTLGNRINGENWDIVTFQENFEYRSNLYDAITNYTIGTDRGGLNYGSAIFGGVSETDGLGFATRTATTSFANETIVEFNDKYGGLTDGANTCIKKGFRYYLVTLPGGAQIDVYVTHMNSGSKEGHINARASQFQQLANYIVANMSTRPTLVLGDFNARYTRDDYTTNFFSILGEAGLMDFFNDAWVELVDKYDINGNLLYAAGEYPDYPSDSLVVTEKYEGAEGDIECTTQGGEVVDKILYINNPNSDVAIFANSFERDMDYTEADHTPVVSEFTYYY